MCTYIYVHYIYFIHITDLPMTFRFSSQLGSNSQASTGGRCGRCGPDGICRTAAIPWQRASGGGGAGR